MVSPQRVMEVLADVVERPASERSAILLSLCAGDAALEREVLTLLRAHELAQAVLPEAVPGEQAGQRIGHFRLLQKIGEGGFGIVWMAEQEEPVRRKVALKVLKAGMDTAQVVARFEAERQALALMDHPNIARIFDGGATPQGRPYFVMELVRGVPITQYCDEASLSPRERLELFIPICHAVQHAHFKGVIHRDLKPSNVLVTLHDGVPVPKVIDFGIAKATQGRLTDRTLFTEFRQMLGTPEYMAPEQAELSGLDVDTRADVYSLGVLLYELLTGTRPFELRNLIEAGYAELLRTIKEVEPQKPSTRVSTLGVRAIDIAKHRRMHPRALGPLMRGDLDWIVMRTLEKERNRRYPSATALAEDLQRHLNSEPVLAGPPSKLYRLRKYVQRHQVGVAASTAVTLAVVAGAAAAGWSAWRAMEQERRATLQAARADAVVDLFDELLAHSDPDHGHGPDYTVQQLLEDFDHRLSGQLADEPEVERRLRATMARSFVGLGAFDAATAQLERMKQLRAQPGGAEAAATPQDLLLDGDILDLQGRCSEAVVSYEAAVRELREPGSSPRDLALALARLQACHLHLDHHELAVELMLEAVELVRGSGDEELLVHETLLLADTLRAAGQEAEAERIYRESGERARALECFPRWEWQYQIGHARVLRDLQRLDEALELGEEALATCRERFGPSSLNTSVAMFLTGTVLARRGSDSAAQGRLEEAWKIRSSLLGQAHPLAREALAALAEAWTRPGDSCVTAERHSRQLIELDRATGLENSVSGATHLLILGQALKLQKRFDEAEEALHSALEIYRAQLDEDDLRVLGAERELLRVAYGRGDLAFAERGFRQLLDELVRLHGPDHAYVGLVWYDLGLVLSSASDSAGAADCFVESLRVQRQVTRASATLAQTLRGLACVRWKSGRIDEARQLYVECRQMCMELGNDQILAECAECQAHHLDDAKDAGGAADLDQAEGLYREALDLRTALGDLPQIASNHSRLGQLLAKRGDTDLAEVELRSALELYRGPVQASGSSYVDTLEALAKVCTRPDADLDELERLLGEALEIRQREGAPATKLAADHYKLADMQASQGRLELAAEHFGAALAIQESLRDDGKSHAGLRSCSERLVGILLVLGRDAEAEPLLREAIEEAPHCDTCSPDLARSRQQLGQILGKRGELAAAEEQLREALALRGAGSGTVEVASVLAALGENLLLQERAAEAEPLLRSCVEIRAERIPDDWLHFNAQSLLGGSLLAQGRTAEAEPLLVNAAERIQPISRLAYRRREAIDRVIALYEATGRHGEAARWRRELAELDIGR